MKKEKFIYDIALNIIASAIPVAVLQLVIYPTVAKQLGGDKYGLMLAIYSLWMIVPNSLGNVLNNIRLLWDKKYLGDNKDGDFNLLYRNLGSAGSFILFLLLWIYYSKSDFCHVIFAVLIGFLIFTKAYLEVDFRIHLNFKLIALNSFIHTTGLLVGLLFFNHTGLWEFIYLFGFAFSVAFCLVKTRLINLSFNKSQFYHAVCNDCNNLVIAAIINSLNSYADKVVLFPLIGGTAVSIYYTATIMGKIVSMMTGPINSVILSYISQWEDSRSDTLKKIFPITLCIAILGYFFTIIICRPVIEFLFPQWVDEVMKLVPITTVAIMLNLVISFINPFVMRFCDRKWQIVINICGASIYFTAALLLWYYKGLIGFCLGTVVGCLCKLATMLTIYHKRAN